MMRAARVRSSSEVKERAPRRPAAERRMLAALAAAMARLQAADAAGAERYCRNALEIVPDQPDALHLLGLAAWQRDRGPAAEALIRRAIERRPGSTLFRNNLAQVLSGMGRTGAAIECLERSLALDPRQDELRRQLARLHLAHGDFATAGRLVGDMLAAQPTEAGALEIAVNAALGQDRAERAIAALDAAHAAGAGSELAPLWIRVGLHEFRARNSARAVAVFEKALACAPDHPEALRGLGIALTREGRLDEAEAVLRRGIADEAGRTRALVALGGLCLRSGRVEDAAQALHEAVERPDATPHDFSCWLMTLDHLPGIDPARVAAEHRRYDARFAAPLTAGTAPPTPEPLAGRRLRLGFVSPDLRAHAVSFFFLPLLAHLDRTRLEVTLYADVARPDGVTADFRAHAERWRPIYGRSDEDVAAQIRNDGIDVLVDLAGHTADNRLTLFARRPAPVQVSYLGYPNTTGLAAMDARIVDPWTDPPGAETLASERLIRLDRCFLTFALAGDAPIAEPPCLTRGRIAFGSFNRIAKLNGEVIALWAELLRRVESAELVLKDPEAPSESVRRHLLAGFASHGVAPERVRFLERAPDLAGHLAQYAGVDIALDPFPYNGTTTTCDALWMGVPVVTLAGAAHPGRVGVSLLTSVGFPAGVAATPEDYLLTAAQLAANPTMLLAIRNLLRTEILTSPLGDARGLAAAFETAVLDLAHERAATVPSEPAA